VRVADRRAFDEDLHNLADLFNLFAGPFAQEPLKPAYKGVTVMRVQFDRNSLLARELNGEGTPVEKRFAPTFYHAHIDGAWYVSFSDAMLKEVIDRSAARREGKAAVPAAEAVAVNDSLYVAPKAAAKARPGLGFYFEWESHRKALANCPPWYALFRCGLVPEEPTDEAMAEAALRYLGFVPVSPEGAAFVYDAKRDEVVNKRHGSLRRPDLHTDIEASAPLSRLLEQFRSMRADLRFTEDGVHTVVTIERKAAEGK
jgi:hypothetical protein